MMGWHYSYNDTHNHHSVTVSVYHCVDLPLRTVGICLGLLGHILHHRYIYIGGEGVWTWTDVWGRRPTRPACHCPDCTFLNSHHVFKNLRISFLTWSQTYGTSRFLPANNLNLVTSDTHLANGLIIFNKEAIQLFLYGSIVGESEKKKWEKTLAFTALLTDF